MVEALPGIQIIDRSSVNVWDDAKVASAIEATGRRKLIFAGISRRLEGLRRLRRRGRLGTFSQTKRESGLLRMQQPV